MARYGFDIVVEATGVEGVAQHALDYVRRGGKLLVYGVYDSSALVHWAPSKIFGDEIQVALVLGLSTLTATHPPYR